MSKSNLILIVIATLGYGYFFFFGSENTYSSKKRLFVERDSLKGVVDSLRGQISADSAIIVGIDSSDTFLEHFARENYYMKSDDEDIFIVK